MDELLNFNFIRVVRTPQSEQYTILSKADVVGHVDIHFTPDTAHASVILVRVISDEHVRTLIAEIDETLIASVLPPYERLDCIITIFHGSEIGTFADPTGDEDLGTDNGN